MPFWTTSTSDAVVLHQQSRKGTLPVDTSVSAAAASSTGTPIAITILVAVISSGVVAAVVNAISGNLRANANVRRDRYAQAVRYLIAWGEYPYRIRRRADDEPETRASLASLGHTLQEQRAEIAGWIAAESRTLSKVFDQCARDISAIVGPACAEAWTSPPITTSAGMNLGDFGPRGVDAIAARMERACGYRFGLRRMMWSSLVLRRIDQWERATVQLHSVIRPDGSRVPSPSHLPSED
jgi:hypothetical protein